MDGNYAITFPDGEPVDTIEHKLEEWNPATIAGLSGKRDQRVHKTMYSQGAGLTVLQAEEVLESLERIYRTNTNRKRTPEEIRGEYREFVEKLLVPKELNARLSAVRALYALPPT